MSFLHRTPHNESNWIHPLSSSTPVASDDVSYHSEVNRELKRLLLASLGSDVQQEIDQLVRDHSHLKQSLDITLHHLTECTEELDQVTVECDIWRSKVLASRVLIDELKKWKVQATSDSYTSQQAITTLLKEREKLSNYLKDCHGILFDIVQILGQRLSSKQLSQQYGGLQVAAVSPIQLSQSIIHVLNIIYALYIALVSNSGGTIVDVAKTTTVAAKVIFEKLNGLDKETLPTSHSTSLHMLPSEGETMAKKVRLVNFYISFNGSM